MEIRTRFAVLDWVYHPRFGSGQVKLIQTLTTAKRPTPAVNYIIQFEHSAEEVSETERGLSRGKASALVATQTKTKAPVVNGHKVISHKNSGVAPAKELIPR